jgi:phosphoglucosamine mutase
MKEHGQLANNKIVTTVMSNIGLYKALDEKGIEYEKTAVGDKYVYENMTTNGHCLGGEQSGHIIFSKHATTGDGILTSLKIMEAIIESKATLSELMRDLRIFPQLLVNVKVTDKNEIMENEKLKEVADKVSKELGSEGRLLLRPSGTEPLIRVMVEAETDELCKKYVDEVVDVINEICK